MHEAIIKGCGKKVQLQHLTGAQCPEPLRSAGGSRAKHTKAPSSAAWLTSWVSYMARLLTNKELNGVLILS